MEMAASEEETQLERSTSETNESTFYFNRLPLRPRLGRSSLRFSPYGKSLTEERNILVGMEEKRVLESESLGEKSTACAAQLDWRLSIGRGQVEREVLGSCQSGKRGGVKVNAKEVTEKSNGSSSILQKGKSYMLKEEVRRSSVDKAMEVFSKDLKSLELSDW